MQGVENSLDFGTLGASSTFTTAGAGLLRATIDINANGDVAIAGAGLIGLDNYAKDSQGFVGDLTSEATSLVFGLVSPLDVKVKDHLDVEGVVMNSLEDFIFNGFSVGIGSRVEQIISNRRKRKEESEFECDNCLNEVTVTPKRR